MDVFVSSFSLLILSPFLGIISILVVLHDRGPVFYRAVRIGRKGHKFEMLKFRTMIVGAEKGPSSTPDNDPRITRLGRKLRELKLDELPQLINVFKGEMSIVGPRPQIPWAVERYSSEEMRLLDVRPGITDLASIRFRNEGEILRGSANPDKDYLEKIAPEKIRLGLLYVEKRTFWFDVSILLKTIGVIFGFDSDTDTLPPKAGSRLNSL